MEEMITTIDNDSPPRTLSVDPADPSFSLEYQRVGVRFDGKERKSDVHSYNVEERWIRVHLRDSKGRFKKERGKFVTVRLNGVVEPYWK